MTSILKRGLHHHTKIPMSSSNIPWKKKQRSFRSGNPLAPTAPTGALVGEGTLMYYCYRQGPWSMFKSGRGRGMT